MSSYLKKVISVVEAAIERKKTSASKASTEAVGNFSLIRNMKAGKSPSIDNMRKLCDVLGLDMYIGLPEDYQGLKTAAVLGSVKGETILSNYDLEKLANPEALEDCEQIPAPVNKGTMIAFIMEDNSLLPAFSKGAAVLFDLGDKCPPSQWQGFIGKLCLVGLKDGTRMLRVLRRGDRPNLFNLESLTGSLTLPDQLPNICLPLRWVKNKG